MIMYKHIMYINNLYKLLEKITSMVYLRVKKLDIMSQEK